MNGSATPPGPSPGSDPRSGAGWFGLGLDYGTVRLVAACPEWAGVAGRLADAIREALGTAAAVVEHVGSTAVPGLATKPIVDLAVGLTREVPQPALTDSLGGLGYKFRGDAGDEGGLVYVLEDRPQHRVAHLHVVDHGCPQWDRYLAFRDLLSRDPSARAVYERMKADLAAAFPNDRKAYQAGKEGTVSELLRRDAQVR